MCLHKVSRIGLLRRILKRLSFLEMFNLRFNVTLNGKVVKIPTIGKIGYSHLQMTDSWMVDILKDLIPLVDGVFIDIGMHLGETLIKVKCIAPDIQYFGFEPNPVCAHYANELIRKNGFENCEVIPVGISDECGFVTLSCYNSVTDPAATIVEGFRSQQAIRYQFWVPVHTFEYVCQKLQIKKISIIKIDVEGAELEVIRSLSSVLREDRPFVLCEILPVYSINNAFRKKRQEEIEELTKTLDYAIFRIEKGKKETLERLRRIEHIDVHSDLSLCDYLFIPNELVGTVPNHHGVAPRRASRFLPQFVDEHR